MSKILSPSELNEVKIFAEKLGFTSRIMRDYATFKKSINDQTTAHVYYDVINGNAYVEINFGSVSITTDEYDKFMKISEEAQSIAKEMEK